MVRIYCVFASTLAPDGLGSDEAKEESFGKAKENLQRFEHKATIISHYNHSVELYFLCKT
jgi:hypothetical protein